MFKSKIRVVKYRRVSTDEQKLKKNSVIAQGELLDEYIKDHPEMVLVGDFCDEAVSGTKAKRSELQALLDLVESGGCDLIIFTKLDRWFRNVASYHQIQEILERHHVAWKAILEEYDTLTADGRLKVHIMLAVAQNEAERTSERIKVVFESKIKHKQVISGRVPFGFKIVDGNGARMLIRDPETEPILRDLLQEVQARHSIRGALTVINDRYDLNMYYNSAHRLIKNPLLYGHYKGVDDFCEGYMSKAEFEALQQSVSRVVRQRATNRIYIFSSLLLCPKCGRRLAGTMSSARNAYGKEYKYKRYRCPSAVIESKCEHVKTYGESALEKKLLQQVLPQFDDLLLSAIVNEKKAAPVVNKKAIQAEISRLNTMFQKGRIDEAEYDLQYEALEQKLYAPEPPKKDYSKIKKLLSGDFVSLYETFSDHEKQIFWRSIVDTIEIDGSDLVINFL